MVAALTPDERTAFVTMQLCHCAEQDKVIAGFYGLREGAGERGHSAFQMGNIRPTGSPIHARETVFFGAPGEALGYMLLILTEDIDYEGQTKL